MNRSPAFSFYPDKWQSHTRRLSDSAYRVYHELLCWMWQHADDHCSIHASPEAVACAVAMPLECVRIALAEIQNPFSPLLKAEGEKWASNGLRKEAFKQGERRDKAKASAEARWKDAPAMRTHTKTNANASSEQCFPSPSPSPSPIETLPALSGGEPVPTEKPNGKNGVFHAQFIEAWVSAYQTDRAAKYIVVGGKDGSAVKRLASAGLPVADLIGLARRAWKARGRPYWHCERAVSISYFAGYLNEIRAELEPSARAAARPLPAGMQVATKEQLARDAAEEF